MRFPRREPAAEADVRPTLLGIVTLLFMLLFFLLSTSSGQRLGVIDLRLARPGEVPPIPHAGLVKDVHVLLGANKARLEFEVQSTDVSAASTAREQRAIDVPAGVEGWDPKALSDAVEQVHDIDRSQDQATVIPDPSTSTDALMAALDAVRGPSDAPRFPRVTLQ